ncbi:MAG: hypothetical protein LBI55_03985 [Oscillospiraceae bacterium]|jgi:hypothetical protein|nr:hypothetical protein [Oscillospiraceae bacterium]
MKKSRLFSRKISRRIILYCFLFLMIVWIIHQVESAISSDVDTEIAILGEMEDTINTKGYAIRKEFLVKLENPTRGVAIFDVKNGQRVSKGGVIANVYENTDDVLAKKRIKAIEYEIEKLKSLNKSRLSFASEPNEISKQICNNIRSNLFETNNHRFQEIFYQKEKILEFLNVRQIITGKIEGFNNRISQLKKEGENLSKSLKDCNTLIVEAPEAGDFMDHLDGFEHMFDFESASSLKPEDINASKLKEDTNDKSVLGKIISDLPWYMVFSIDSKNAEKFKEDTDVFLSIPTVTSDKIPAKIVAINKSIEQQQSSLICCCDYMNNEILNFREGETIIKISSSRGIKISKKSLRKETVKKIVEGKEEEKNITGVFVLHGNKIIFKEVCVLYLAKDENYVICQSNPDPKVVFHEDYLKVYDNVVISGSDLFDGKIVK